MSPPEIADRVPSPKLRIPGIPGVDPLDLCVLGCLVAWAAVALAGRPIGDYGVETDFYGDFAPGARRWMEGTPSAGNGFRGPFYYLLIGAGDALLGDAFLAGKLLSVVAIAAGLRVLGGLVRRLFGAPAAGIAVLTVAANPVLAGHAFRACSDTVFWFLFVSTLACLFAGAGAGTAFRFGARLWFLAGLSAGAAWLTRYNGGILLPMALGVACLAVRPPLLALRRVGLFLLGGGMLALPWAVFLWQETGNPFWNTNYQNFAIEVFAPDPSVAQQGQFMRAVGFTSYAEVLAVYPLRVGVEMVHNLGSHFVDDIRLLVGWPVAIIAALGYVVEGRRWARPLRLAFLAAGGLTYLSLLPVFYNPRFMLPLVAWWGTGVGLAARFLIARVPALRIPERWTGWPRGAVLLWALATAFAIRSNAVEISRSLDPRRSEAPPMEILHIAQEARRQGIVMNSGTPIAARKPHIGYYLDAPVVPIPFGDLSALRESGAHYLLVSPIEANLYPSLAPLAEIPPGMLPPPGLRPVARVRETLAGFGSRTASLYAILNPRPGEPALPARPTTSSEVVAGMDRLDTLRLRLARWTFVWAPDLPVRPWLARMSAPGKSHWETQLLEGDLSLREGNLDAAASLYGMAREARPREPRVLCRLAGISFLRGDREGMHGLLAEVEPSVPGPGSMTSWCDWGARFQDAGETAAALAPLAAGLEESPGSYVCLESLGTALLGLDRLDDALPFLRQALRLQPANRHLADVVHTLESRAGSDADAVPR